MSEIILCEKCGEQMININSEHTVGMTCPKCGWGWVTSRFDPIATDETDYSVFIKPDNPAVPSNIKLIADIAGVNFLQAKKLLSSGNDELVYKAKNESASTMYKAQRVQAVAKKLKEAGIVFTITPEFPFEV
jgi:hypothetical protein